MREIAIVGRACVLPGALSPEALWQAVVEGRDLTTSVDPAPVGWVRAGRSGAWSVGKRRGAAARAT
ncbi:MAG: hypothetical protein IPO66_08935 [Rhodanobacteraceae bacterium]|nr:hypothetical protein [Rhodanobacteraceae bacterium]